MSKARPHQVNVHLTTAEYEALKALAEATRQSLSQVARRGLVEFLAGPAPARMRAQARREAERWMAILEEDEPVDLASLEAGPESEGLSLDRYLARPRNGRGYPHAGVEG